MDNDRQVRRRRRLLLVAALLDTYGMTVGFRVVTLPSWMPSWMWWTPPAAVVLAMVILTVILWPAREAGPGAPKSSVNRCALGLLAVLWPSRLVRRMRYSAALAEHMVAYAVALQPARYREHYQAMWLGDLDWLKAQDAPVLGWAVGMLSTAVMTRLALRARLAHAARQVRSLPQSPVARLISRYRPLGLGLLTAAGVFCAAAAGWSGVGYGPPSRAQLLWAISASVLTGGVATWQAWPRGPAADEPTCADEPVDEGRP